MNKEKEKDLQVLLGGLFVCRNCYSKNILQANVNFVDNKENGMFAISKCDCNIFYSLQFKKYKNLEEFKKQKKVDEVYEEKYKNDLYTFIYLFCDCQYFKKLIFQIPIVFQDYNVIQTCDKCNSVYTLELRVDDSRVNKNKKSDIIISGKPKSFKQGLNEFENEYLQLQRGKK